MPKLRMIWSGETVLVSKLVSDHTKTVRRRNFLHDSRVDKKQTRNDFKRSESSESNVLQFSDDNQKYENQPDVTLYMDTGESTHAQLADSSSPLNKKDISSKQFSVADRSNSSSIRKFWNMHSRRDLSSVNITEHPTNAEVAALPSKLLQHSHASASSMRQKTNMTDPSNGSNNGNAVYISTNAAPSRRLLIPLVEMQSTLQEMNQRIMSGLGVSESEWVKLRQQSVDLGQLFHDQVHFQWEQQSSSFATKSEQNGLSPDIESNIRTKQFSLDTFDESDNEDDEEHYDDDTCFNQTKHKLPLPKNRLEL
jgi:hypothetical protein